VSLIYIEEILKHTNAFEFHGSARLDKLLPVPIPYFVNTGIIYNNESIYSQLVVLDTCTFFCYLVTGMKE
jgi:hypothetical protein